MPTGRCSGCGQTGTVTKISSHILDCPDYLTLFSTDPAACLAPAAAAEQHRSSDTATARATRRDQRLRVRFAELDREIKVQTGRWRTPPDLLGE